MIPVHRITHHIDCSHNHGYRCNCDRVELARLARWSLRSNVVSTLIILALLAMVLK